MPPAVPVNLQMWPSAPQEKKEKRRYREGRKGEKGEERPPKPRPVTVGVTLLLLTRSVHIQNQKKLLKNKSPSVSQTDVQKKKTKKWKKKEKKERKGGKKIPPCLYSRTFHLLPQRLLFTALQAGPANRFSSHLQT